MGYTWKQLDGKARRERSGETLLTAYVPEGVPGISKDIRTMLLLDTSGAEIQTIFSISGNWSTCRQFDFKTPIGKISNKKYLPPKFVRGEAVQWHSPV